MSTYARTFCAERSENHIHCIIHINIFLSSWCRRFYFLFSHGPIKNKPFLNRSIWAIDGTLTETTTVGVMTKKEYSVFLKSLASDAVKYPTQNLMVKLFPPLQADTVGILLVQLTEKSFSINTDKLKLPKCLHLRPSIFSPYILTIELSPEKNQFEVIPYNFNLWQWLPSRKKKTQEIWQSRNPNLEDLCILHISQEKKC